MKHTTTNRMIKLTKLTTLFFLICFFSISNLFADDTYRLSPSTYSETIDFIALAKTLFGDTASLADWSNIKSMIGSDNAKLAEFYLQIGLSDEAAAWVSKDGNRFYSGNRHYFIQRFSNGKPASFLAHDQIGSLYLGSWYGISVSFLAKTNNDTSTYRLSAPKYSESADLDTLAKNLFGDAVSLADWSNIISMIGSDNTKLAEFYLQIGLGDEGAAWVSKDGNRFYSGNRHYFIQRFDTGKPASFLAHDQIGSLYLGSWYGLNLNILTQKKTNTTSIDHMFSIVPHKIHLYQNYPNPFNPTTRIFFVLDKSSFVNLKIYNSNGQLISELISQNLQSGFHSFNFDASKFPSGLYFCSLTTDSFKETKRMLLLK
jgi:hypothetical protein